MRKAILGFLVLFSLVASMIQPTFAANSFGVQQPSDISTSDLTSEGYLYFPKLNDNKTIQRYHIQTGELENLNTTDQSCVDLMTNASIFEIVVDESRARLYWSSNSYYRGLIVSFDLRSGICEPLFVGDYLNANTNNEPFILGLAYADDRLFFVDQQNYNKTYEEDNKTVGVIEFSGDSSSVTLLNMKNPDSSSSMIQFGSDIIVEGDYAYVAAKGFAYWETNIPPSERTDAIYRVKVLEEGEILTTTTAVKIVSIKDANATYPILNHLELHGDDFIMSTYDYNTAGLLKINVPDRSTRTTSKDPADVELVIQNEAYAGWVPTGQYCFGFALGQNDELFTIDFASAVSYDFVLWHSTLTDPTPFTATLVPGEIKPDTYWGNITYSASLLPAPPSPINAVRTTSTSVTINFEYPVLTDNDGYYTWVASADGQSDVTGDCVGSPCVASGLTDGIEYTFKLKQVWQMQGANAIAHSPFSDTFPTDPPIIESVDPESGPIGTQITITGSGFSLDMVIEIDGVPCENVSIESETSATCEIPSNLSGEVDLVVTNPDLQSDTELMAFSILSPMTEGTIEITGDPKVGEVLSAQTSGWDSGVEFTYQWYRDGLAIDGANEADYLLTEEDAGAQITVSVIANKNGFIQITSSTQSYLEVAPLSTGKKFKKVTKIFSGFAYLQHGLTKKMKKQMRAWLKKYPTAKSVSCLGITGLNWEHKSDSFIKKVGKLRAQVSCRYLKSRKTGLSIEHVKNKATNHWWPEIRSVRITIKYRIN